MKDRITVKHLECLVDEINRVTGSPANPYTRTADGKLVANIGNYHLSGAYGGYCLHRMCNDCGGVTTPISHGHIPKRDLYNRMRSYLDGINAGRKA